MDSNTSFARTTMMMITAQTPVHRGQEILQVEVWEAMGIKITQTMEVRDLIHLGATIHG